MKKYIGVKIVEAKPMNKYEFFISHKGEECKEDNEEGYMVKYPDGYESWCPKKQFEEANTPCDGMTFGHAIEALKKGLMVARKGWNGKGMFVFKQVPSPIAAEIVPRMTSLPQSVKDEFVRRNQGPTYDNQMAIVKQCGTVDSWVASSSDTFAEDWQVID